MKHWMAKHGEDNECPAFRLSVLDSYRDCVSWQVAEALKIQKSKDSLLNSKSEYASNCLARVCLDMDRYERRRLEKMDRKQDKKELKDMDEFKGRRI